MTSRKSSPTGAASNYAHDLPSEAIRQLSDPGTAHAGRYLRHTAYPQTQELPVFKRSYRILYLIKEADGVVEVLRFWHSHRDEPFKK
jgi:ParE toxin of type II toxin-antitoxin system, parDE